MGAKEQVSEPSYKKFCIDQAALGIPLAQGTFYPAGNTPGIRGADFLSICPRSAWIQ